MRMLKGSFHGGGSSLGCCRNLLHFLRTFCHAPASFCHAIIALFFTFCQLWLSKYYHALIRLILPVERVVSVPLAFINKDVLISLEILETSVILELWSWLLRTRLLLFCNTFCQLFVDFLTTFCQLFVNFLTTFCQLFTDFFFVFIRCTEHGQHSFSRVSIVCNSFPPPNVLSLYFLVSIRLIITLIVWKNSS